MFNPLFVVFALRHCTIHVCTITWTCLPEIKSASPKKKQKTPQKPEKKQTNKHSQKIISYIKSIPNFGNFFSCLRLLYKRPIRIYEQYLFYALEPLIFYSWRQDFFSLSSEFLTLCTYCLNKKQCWMLYKVS